METQLFDLERGLGGELAAAARRSHGREEAWNRNQMKVISLMKALLSSAPWRGHRLLRGGADLL